MTIMNLSFFFDMVRTYQRVLLLLVTIYQRVFAGPSYNLPESYFGDIWNLPEFCW